MSFAYFANSQDFLPLNSITSYETQFNFNDLAVKLTWQKLALEPYDALHMSFGDQINPGATDAGNDASGGWLVGRFLRHCEFWFKSLKC